MCSAQIKTSEFVGSPMKHNRLFP